MGKIANSQILLRAIKYVREWKKMIAHVLRRHDEETRGLYESRIFLESQMATKKPLICNQRYICSQLNCVDSEYNIGYDIFSPNKMRDGVY